MHSDYKAVIMFVCVRHKHYKTIRYLNSQIERCTLHRAQLIAIEKNSKKNRDWQFCLDCFQIEQYNPINSLTLNQWNQFMCQHNTSDNLQ